jgi:hypothetical protein
VLRAAVLALALLACGRDLGPPREQPLPQPDKPGPLRNGDHARSPRIASYKIEATLDPAKHLVTATQTLTWKNTGTTSVDKLPFHLYLNAFKNDSSLLMRSSHGSLRGQTPGAWGWIQIQSVQIGGVELVSKLARPKLDPPADLDETVVELALPTAIEAGTTVEIRFAFTAQLPEVFARTGFKGDFHLVAQWFPKIGVRVGPPGAEVWECRPFHAHSEFFSDFGNYDVTLTVPSTYVVAATGVLAAAADGPGGTRTLTYHARDVHDFVWMADPYMQTLTRDARVEDGTVQVRVLHRPEQEEFAQRHLDAAVGAVEKYSAAYLPYPWSVLTIVDPPMDAQIAAGGMEYQTLVTTNGDTVFARPGLRLPEFVTIHEVGHQWFQGMLASNEAAEPWLDEGVNQWANGKVMNELYGARGSAIDWLGWEADTAELFRALVDTREHLPVPIASAAAMFPDEDTYVSGAYDATMRALRTIELAVGPTRFAAAMRAYARKFAFQHPTGRDLFDTLQQELGMDLTWFFEPVFQKVGGMRLALRSAECRGAHAPRGVVGDGPAKKLTTEHEAPYTGSYDCEVIITNTGVVHVPVEIELRFEDGSLQELEWDARGSEHWKAFSVKASTPLAEVKIDPKDKIWLDSPIRHHYRVQGNGDASFRAAAWFAAHAQTLMQVLGP